MPRGKAYSTSENNTKKSLAAKTVVNKEKKPNKIEADNDDKVYICQTCGKVYKKRQGNFTPCKSPLYAGTDGYINTCKSCIDKLFEQLTEFYNGSEEKAIERICQIFDLYFNESPLAASKKISEGRSRINSYFAKINILPHTGKTYSDTIIERANNAICDIENYEELIEEGKIDVSKELIEKWGSHNSEDDIRILEEHYKFLKKHNPNCDNNQEIFIKDLCFTKLLQTRAIQKGDTDAFDKLTKLYRDTFKQAGLKTIQENDSSNDETLGVTLATISQYTPEEYYKDKNLYKDFDGLGEYITRFLLRPLKNLITGSNERDKEYCVEDTDNDEYDE